MKRLAAGLVLQGVWLASPVLLPAQQRVDPRTPEAVLEAFFAALDAQQWREAVELLEPTDLDVFRRGMARRLREPSPPDLTVEDFLRGDPNMPRVVAEYQHEQYLQNRGTLQEFLSEQFAGVRNADELDSLPIEELAVRWLQAQHPVTELLTELKGKGCPIPEGMDSTRGLIKPLILGPVFTEMHEAFVVFHYDRSEVPGGFYNLGPAVAALRLTERGWRILPRVGLINAPNSVRSLMRCD